MGGAASANIPMYIDLATFRSLSGGTLNDGLFEANSKDGVMTREKLFELASVRDCYLSHEWGVDAHGRLIFDRVFRINQALRARGLYTWFNETQLGNDFIGKMTEGIDKSRTMVVFLTRGYMSNVSNYTTDNCHTEFSYEIAKKHPDLMIPVIFEEQLLNKSLWFGPVKIALGDASYIDFVSDDNFDGKIDELYKRIMKLSRNPINVNPQLTASNTTLSKTNKSKEEQQFFQWLARSTNIDEGRRIIYCHSLVKAGIGSVQALAKTMLAMPTFLQSIGVNEYDADAIALAISDLGLGYVPVRDFSNSLTLESVVFALNKSDKAPHDNGIAESALACVARVAASNQILPSVMHDAGIGMAVLKIMGRLLQHPLVIDYGCQSLHNLTVGHPEIAGKLGAVGACDVLPRSIRCHVENESVAAHGCQAIATLAAEKDNRSRFSSSGGCDVAVKTLFKHNQNSTVTEKCCLAINGLLTKHPENLERLATAGACEAASIALSNHPTNRVLVEATMEVISTLALEPNCRANFGQSQYCFPALIKALQAMITYPEVIAHGCYAIHTLCIGNGFNRNKLGQVGACELTKDILQRHGGNPVVAPAVCKSIFALVAGNNEHKAKFSPMVNFVQSIINNPAMPPETKNEARETLKRL
eukprot:gene12742-17083_t